MSRAAASTAVRSASHAELVPGLGVDTRHLGRTLRSLYEESVDGQPIPDTQIDLLLRLRQKERALRRTG